MNNKKAKRQPNSIFCCLVTNVIMAFILTVSHINFFHENTIFPVPYQQSRFQLVPSPLRKFKATKIGVGIMGVGAHLHFLLSIY